jgi:hypothetical protein
MFDMYIKYLFYISHYSSRIPWRKNGVTVRTEGFNEIEDTRERYKELGRGLADIGVGMLEVASGVVKASTGTLAPLSPPCFESGFDHFQSGWEHIKSSAKDEK